MLDELPLITERLQNVEIRNDDWRAVLSEYSGPEVLFYLDPPYPKSTRVFKKAYVLEMTHEDHVALLTELTRKKARVALSSYPSPLYNEMLSNWECLQKGIVNHSSHEKKKEKKTECLWVI
jgi:DNA adenine methylase